jgi:hypothetical protein
LCLTALRRGDPTFLKGWSEMLLPRKRLRGKARGMAC